MAWPDAEVPVDEHLVGALLLEQHPDLVGHPLTLLDAGWDNIMWGIGEGLAVRMPRRLVSSVLVRKEQRWLPELAADLPMPVPVPRRVGRPGLGYPWYWSVVPWLVGQPGDVEAVTNAEASAERLGQFLAALHRPAPPGAPYNEHRSISLRERTGDLDGRVGQLAGLIDGDSVKETVTAAAAADPHPGPPTWIHGDLHPANLLVDRGTVAAVIDFGDLCAGDPATDVAGMIMLLPRPAHPAFWAAYGRHDPALEARARGWAAWFGVMLVEIGRAGRPTYETAGRAALHRLMPA